MAHAADLDALRVAIVHYWFMSWRGGERVVASLLDIFPRADVYTLFYDPQVCGVHLAGRRVTTSVLDHPRLRRHYQMLAPLYPLALRSLRLDTSYDLVISSESGPAKGVRVPTATPHLCYVHTPMRYCWSHRSDYLATLPGWQRGAADLLLERLRSWDASTIDNVDYYVANSRNVAKRVERFYRRAASVCHPPVDSEHFAPGHLVEPGRRRAHYLSLGAITPYKGIRLLVETFNASGKPLVIVGDGSERQKLEHLAGDNIRFTGTLEWGAIRTLLRTAGALVFPGEEDFGLAPLEVMAHGVPVIALARGGALETVVAGATPEESTGVFFKEPTPSALTDAITRFEAVEDRFRPAWIRDHARRFGADVFQRRMVEEVRHLLATRRQDPGNRRRHPVTPLRPSG